ncbi:hypothetical protein NQ176_g4719 [Zarea fungicola]|uniref:Uncharacterized protein n=1 Tax=Zarea fungicola TaxID=93591 RepID=A0ACC1NDA5_9HYPO|nr:hypothetical protein NQ176_g4719 [Lecanicillium fungicola]
MSYNDGECTRDQFHGRAHIERGDFESCITFPSLAFGFQVAFLKMCGYDEQKDMILAARTRDADLAEEDWFFPNRDKLELVLNWHSYQGKKITNPVDKPRDN